MMTNIIGRVGEREKCSQHNPALRNGASPFSFHSPVEAAIFATAHIKSLPAKCNLFLAVAFSASRSERPTTTGTVIRPVAKYAAAGWLGACSYRWLCVLSGFAGVRVMKYFVLILFRLF